VRRVVTLVLLGLAALALAIGTGGAAPAQSPIAYPVEPREIGGGDPLADVPPPDECSKVRDRPGRLNYFPLSTLKSRNADNPFVSGDRNSVALDLVNKKEQRFRIYVSATTRTILTNFIATSSACFEMFALPQAPKTLVAPVNFDSVLVAAAASGTGSTQDALAVLRDQLLAAGQPASLDDVVAKAGGDPAAVQAQAVADAKAALDAKVAAGELTAAEVAALVLPTIMADLGSAPGAWFLYRPGEIAASSAQLSKQLLTDKRGVVVVAGVPVSQPPSKLNVVWFAFDPKLSVKNGLTHNFIAQRHVSSSVEIYAWKGAETLKFWRQAPYYLWIGQRMVSAANPSSAPALTHSSSPNTRCYDASVKGTGPAGEYSQYSIYGWYVWKLGSGCAP
jgi:hypothetical protein